MRTAFSKTLVCVVPMFVVLAALACWNPRGDFWGSVEPPKAQCEAYSVERLRTATVLDSTIYDGAKLNRLLREPQNTVSNLAYVFVGIAVAASGRRWLSLGFAAACVFLGIGSGLYHASLLPAWRMLDILGVYAVLFCLVALGIGTVFRAKRFELPVTFVAWMAAFFCGIHRNDYRVGGFKLLDSTYVVVGCVAVGSVCALLALWSCESRRRAFGFAGLLAVSAPLAFFGGIADRFRGSLAAPDAIVQGHTLWHFFGAVALLATYEVFAAAGYDRSAIVGARESNQTRDPVSLTPGLSG